MSNAYINGQQPINATPGTTSSPTQPAATTPTTTAKPAPKQYLSPFDSAPQKEQTSAQKTYQADGFSMAQVLGVLGKASQDAMRAASAMSIAANKGLIDAKQAGVNETKNQVHGEQVSEATKFGGSLGAAGATAAMAYKGSSLMTSLPKPNATQTAEKSANAYVKRQTRGTMLDATAKAIAQPVNETVNTADKLGGGAHEADDAKIAIKIDEVNEQTAKTQAESTKQSVQQAQESIKNVSSVSLAHLQRWEGVYSRI